MRAAVAQPVEGAGGVRDDADLAASDAGDEPPLPPQIGARTPVIATPRTRCGVYLIKRPQPKQADLANKKPNRRPAPAGAPPPAATSRRR